MTTIQVNQRTYQVEADENMPLLWVLRDILGLTGTKYGCGVAQCGACTVHMNGEAVRSCVTRLKRAAGQEVITIEGLSAKNDHPLQLAWAELIRGFANRSIGRRNCRQNFRDRFF